MDTNKRDFLKLSAMAASVFAADCLMPRGAFAAAAFPPGPSLMGDAPYAAGAKLAEFPKKAITLEECQSLDYNEMAARSAMVQAGWKYLQSEIDAIEDPALRALIADIYNDPTPKLANMDASRRKEVWKQLSSAGYTKQSEEDFLPPVPSGMKSKYPFVSAAGSGYGSHHFYPGGLVMHVAPNVKLTGNLVDLYRVTYGYSVNRDIAMASQLLHDLHKPYVFQWNADASSRPEQTLAATGQHHVLSAAEVLVRKGPAEVIIAQACAHNNPGSDETEAEVVMWLKAAAIIAGVDPVKYGLLDPSGKTLPQPRRQEGFLCHLGDHDYVLSVPAVRWTTPLMQEIAKTDYKLSDNDMKGKPYNTLRNMIYSQLSAMRLHQASTQGIDQVRALMHSVVKPA